MAQAPALLDQAAQRALAASGAAVYQHARQSGVRCAQPELALLSALAHGRGEHGEAVGLAALAGCEHLDNASGALYADLIFDRLGDIRACWRS